MLEEQGLKYQVNHGTVHVVPLAEYTVQVDDRDQDKGKITWMKDMQDTVHGLKVKGGILYHYDIQGRFLHMAVSCV